MHKKTFHAIAVVIFLLLHSFFALAEEPVDYQEQYRKKLLERGTQSMDKLRTRNARTIAAIGELVHRLAKEKRLEWEFENFDFKTREIKLESDKTKLGPLVKVEPDRSTRFVINCWRRIKTDDGGQKANQSNVESNGVSMRQKLFDEKQIVPYNQLENLELFKKAVGEKFGLGMSYMQRLALSSKISLSKIELQEDIAKSPEIMEKFINCYETTYTLASSFSGNESRLQKAEAMRVKGLIEKYGLQDIASLEYQNRNDVWTVWTERSELKNPQWRLVFRFQPFPHDGKTLDQVTTACNEAIQASLQAMEANDEAVQLDEIFSDAGFRLSIADSSLISSSPILRAERLLAEVEYPLYQEGDIVEISFSPVERVARRTYYGNFKRIGRFKLSIGKELLGLDDIPQMLRVRFDNKLNVKAKLDFLKKHVLITNYKNAWDTDIRTKLNKEWVSSFEKNLNMGFVYVDDAWLLPEELAERIVKYNMDKVWYMRTPNGALDKVDPYRIIGYVLGYYRYSNGRYWRIWWAVFDYCYSYLELDGDDIYEYAKYHNIPLDDEPLQKTDENSPEKNRERMKNSGRR
ncbi:MAG: hypothetical protein IKO40_04685 [Kiritimatiellae bacterium]|nr:hypothetical protein [Kiritimatiellia bacterium]